MQTLICLWIVERDVSAEWFWQLREAHEVRGCAGVGGWGTTAWLLKGAANTDLRVVIRWGEQ